MLIEESVQKFILICRNLSIDSYLSTFSDRKRIQKIFYILKQFGLDYKIRHNWYKHGPYSPKLADIYYQVKNVLNDHKPIDSTYLKDNDLEVIERARPFIDELKEDSNKLEYYASILFIKNDMLFTSSKKNESAIENKVKDLKPHLYSPQKYEEALKKLGEYDLV